MDNDEKELLDFYRKLDAINKMNARTHIQIACTAQESIKRQYGLLPESGQAPQAQSRAGA